MSWYVMRITTQGTSFRQTFSVCQMKLVRYWPHASWVTIYKKLKKHFASLSRNTVKKEEKKNKTQATGKLVGLHENAINEIYIN